MQMMGKIIWFEPILSDPTPLKKVMFVSNQIIHPIRSNGIITNPIGWDYKPDPIWSSDHIGLKKNLKLNKKVKSNWNCIDMPHITHIAHTSHISLSSLFFSSSLHNTKAIKQSGSWWHTTAATHHHSGRTHSQRPRKS